jgi:HEAT repeat protein
VRYAAVFALWRIATIDDATLAVLAGAFDDDDPGIRLYAALAHWGAKGDTPLVLPVLKRSLRDRDPGVRAQTALALEHLARDLGDRARDVAGALNEALEDREHGVRVSAARALWAMRAPLKKEQLAGVIPALIDALEEGDEHARFDAAQGLLDADIRLPGRLAYPLLMRMSQDDPSADVRGAAKTAAGKLGRPTEADVFTLTAHLKDKSGRCRSLAAESLRMVRPKDARAVEALAVVVREDAAIEARLQAAAALGAIGPPATAAVPALAAALKDREPDLRAAAADALGQIGPDAKDAVPGLVDRLKDEEEAVRRAAGEALKKIDPQAAVRAGVP